MNIVIICPDVSIAELLSRFVDLLNEHGIESENVKRFRSIHKNNKELQLLIDETIYLRSVLQQKTQEQGKQDV
jgi:hypothetical protein